jgi:hypothetical protein
MIMSTTYPAEKAQTLQAVCSDTQLSKQAADRKRADSNILPPLVVGIIRSSPIYAARRLRHRVRVSRLQLLIGSHR